MTSLKKSKNPRFVSKIREELNKKNRTFVRFAFVGVINTAFGIGTFALLRYFGVHYAIASLLSQILGILFNFKTTGRFVFKNNDKSLFYRFLAVYAFTYVLNVGFLRIVNTNIVNNQLTLLVRKLLPFLISFDASKMIDCFAAALLSVPIAVVVFLLQKKFVFRKKESAE